MKKLALFALCFLTACQQPTTYAPKVSDAELATEEANQQRIVDQMAKQGGAPRAWRNRDGMRKQFERVASRIETAGAKLCQEMGLPQQGRRCYFYFATSRDPDLNAHADGKTVVVNSGMLRFVGGDDELAGVVAHELAHNMMAHIDAQKTNALIGAIAMAAIGGAINPNAPVSTQNGWINDGAQMGLLSYSVDFEQEADYVGLYIAARAGYDISRIPNLWRRMSVEEPDGIYDSVTHPSNAERFVMLQKTVEEIAYKRKNHVPLRPDLKEQVASN